eukprot:SAG22_NODE_5112_length_1083_cov_1.786585_1_plen_258_part_01
MSRAVPWADWAEWSGVRQNLFSGDSQLVSRAIRRVGTWRSRGRLPVAVQTTAALFEIRLAEGSRSPLELRMLYSMAMVRMVNGVCDASQKGKSAMSVMSIARRHGLPPALVDLRHAATHGDLPSLSALRVAAAAAIDWLVAKYWAAQGSAAVETSENMLGTAKKELLAFLDTFRTQQATALRKQADAHGGQLPPTGSRPRQSRGKADPTAPLMQLAEDPTVMTCMLVDTILDDGVIVPKLANSSSSGSGSGSGGSGQS